MRELQKREIEIEEKAAEYAQSQGMLLKKCSIPGERNWPDRQGFCPDAHVFFIEFKRPGEEPRKAQLQNHRMLERLSFRVYVCDNLKHAKQIIDKEMKIAKSNLRTA